MTELLFSIWGKITAAITGLVLAVGSIFSPEPVGISIPTVVARFETSLVSAISSTDSSMTLVSGTDKAGNPLDGYYCFALDGGTVSEEFVCGTASTTAVTSLTRGLSPVNPSLSVDSLKKAHRRGASVIITDYTALAVLARILNGQDTVPNTIQYSTTSSSVITSGRDLVPREYADDRYINASSSDTAWGIITFNQIPISGTNPINSNQVANKSYVDATGALGGFGLISVVQGDMFYGSTTANNIAVLPKSTLPGGRYISNLGPNNDPKWDLLQLSALATSTQNAFLVASTSQVAELSTTTTRILMMGPGGQYFFLDNVGTAGQALMSNGPTVAPTFQTFPGQVTADIFTASSTWTKPSGARFIYVEIIGAGGGGGGGNNNVGGGPTGGSGGGGGAYRLLSFRANDLPATTSIEVGMQGIGGAVESPGTAGARSCFGSICAYGGGGGGPGISVAGTVAGGGGGGWLSAGTNGTSTATGNGGGPAFTTASSTWGGQGADSPNSLSGVGNAEYGGGPGGNVTESGEARAGGSSLYGAGGGGGGGRSGTPGAAGGACNSYTAGGGGAENTAGKNASTSPFCFSGAGGGGDASAGGGSGGAGGIPGGGGGGGGSTGNVASSNAGTGGAGARGEVRVYSW